MEIDDLVMWHCKMSLMYFLTILIIFVQDDTEWMQYLPSIDLAMYAKMSPVDSLHRLYLSDEEIKLMVGFSKSA